MCLKNEVVLSIIHSFFIVMCRQCKYNCLKRKIQTEKTRIDSTPTSLHYALLTCLSLQSVKMGTFAALVRESLFLGINQCPLKLCNSCGPAAAKTKEREREARVDSQDGTKKGKGEI
ncbi:hypothetical protein H0G86_000873 [Trichoderma simmonsii]|uniref:Uncharacterized protein n=1 Tax=Trichoderma simmonsii TaxID=1491479 RepID=A0A8G0PEE2_9HYPO|nr:hypothetical protein H0G86_000873 [Trichoderma simmonsii]